jgi:TatD DNase family protein
MNLPSPEDFIDIHNHGAKPAAGIFQVENLMTHENRQPDFEAGLTFTVGIHPWFLTEETYNQQAGLVQELSAHTNIIALGETGFDKLKGADPHLQKTAFEEHVRIAEMVSKPVFIHCVRAWDELLSVYKNLRPKTPWIIHGFRGKKELAIQLISKGMYLSFWYDFIIRSEASSLMKSLPKERIFLETDGSDIDIKLIYEKVAADLNLTINELKQQIFSNFKTLFK